MLAIVRAVSDLSTYFANILLDVPRDLEQPLQLVSQTLLAAPQTNQDVADTVSTFRGTTRPQQKTVHWLIPYIKLTHHRPHVSH